MSYCHAAALIVDDCKRSSYPEDENERNIREKMVTPVINIDALHLSTHIPDSAAFVVEIVAAA